MMHYPEFSVGHVRYALRPDMVRIVLQIVHMVLHRNHGHDLKEGSICMGRLFRPESRAEGRDKCIYDENNLLKKTGFLKSSIIFWSKRK